MLSAAPTSAMPGLTLKAWGFISSAGVVTLSNNIASATWSAGDCTVVFSTAMPSANYFVKVQPEKTTRVAEPYSKTAAQCIIAPRNHDATTYGTIDFWVEVYA